MDRKTRTKSSTVLRYFYLNNRLHKVLRRSRAEDLLVAWDYQSDRRVAYSLTDVNKNKQHAYSMSQVVKIIGKHEDTIKLQMYKGNLKYPQQSYSLNGNKTPGKYFPTNLASFESHLKSKIVLNTSSSVPVTPIPLALLMCSNAL